MNISIFKSFERITKTKYKKNKMSVELKNKKNDNQSLPDVEVDVNGWNLESYERISRIIEKCKAQKWKHKTNIKKHLKLNNKIKLTVVYVLPGIQMLVILFRKLIYDHFALDFVAGILLVIHGTLSKLLADKKDNIKKHKESKEKYQNIINDFEKQTLEKDYLKRINGHEFYEDVRDRYYEIEKNVEEIDPDIEEAWKIEASSKGLVLEDEITDIKNIRYIRQKQSKRKSQKSSSNFDKSENSQEEKNQEVKIDMSEANQVCDEWAKYSLGRWED